eukprot:10797-Eustigmatos_ZCMA.PRE.1
MCSTSRLSAGPAHLGNISKTFGPGPRMSARRTSPAWRAYTSYHKAMLKPGSWSLRRTPCPLMEKDMAPEM